MAKIGLYDIGNATDPEIQSVRSQMQWSKEGTHLLLQTRVQTLNGELAGIFKRWYLDLDRKAEEIRMAA